MGARGLNAPDLVELQTRFQAFILRDAESPPPGLQALGSTVYAEAYFLRLTEALVNDYPVLQQLLGETGFAGMARTYALASPSRHFSVRWFGQHLAPYLQMTSPYAAEPYLGELAAFEWLMGEAFDAANAPTIGADRLAAIPVAAWPDLTLAFHPSVRRLDVQHDVPAIWQSRGSELATAAQGANRLPMQIAVWRRGLDVYFRPLVPGEALSLDALLAGETFAVACERLAADISSGDEPAIRIVGWLRQWLADGLIAGAA
jgi:hypothetical protein